MIDSREIADLLNEEYNVEPVHYCKHCLSLRVMSVADVKDSDFCDDCNSTDIVTGNIRDWENLYQEKYGYKFLDKKIKWKRKRT